MRAEAEEELRTVIHERARNGEDPWSFMTEIPTVDELVVWMLRADRMRISGVARADGGAQLHLLRGIAADYAPLAPAVWSIIGDLALDTPSDRSR